MPAVRFLKAWSLYNSGEVASFDAETAETLINAGVAVTEDAAKPAKKAATKKAATPEKTETADAAAQVDGANLAQAEGSADAA